MVAIHETCHTYECRKFGRKFTTYLQLSYADHKSTANLTDNQQLLYLYTSYCYMTMQIMLENFILCKYTFMSFLTSSHTKTNGK